LASLRKILIVFAGVYARTEKNQNLNKNGTLLSLLELQISLLVKLKMHKINLLTQFESSISEARENSNPILIEHYISVVD
jgi:hypothetical protein